MEKLTLYRPKLEELAFKEQCLADPETMAYNHAWGGTIPFPREAWADWYEWWMEDGSGERFFRYLRRESGEFVGYISYHYDRELGMFCCEVLVAAQYRGRGYGRAGLALLCAAAKENGVKTLYDTIALDNTATKLFLEAGFRERRRTEEYIFLEKEL